MKSFLRSVFLFPLSLIMGTILYMDKAAGVTPAADDAAGTAQPTPGTFPPITAVHDADTVTVEAKLTTTAAHLFATNDILVAVPLPPNHVLVDCYIATGDIDTGASLALTVAQLTKDFTDIVANTNLITASTVGQAGGVARAAVAAGLQLAPLTTTRWFGIKVAAGAAGVNADAVLSLVLQYRAANAD